MLFKAGHQCGRVGVIESIGQPLQLPCIRWQFMGLLVVQQLQGMFHGAQKHVAGAELPIPLSGDQAEFRLPHECIQSVCGQHARFFESVDQLQGLSEKLDIANRTCSQFHLRIQLAALPESLFNFGFHGLHSGQHLCFRGCEQQRSNAVQEAGAQCGRAGNRAGLEHGLFFPEFRVLCQVISVGRRLADQRPGFAPGTEPQVDAVQESRRRVVGQTVDHQSGQSLGLWRLLAADEHEVDIGTVVQFFAAQFTEGNDGDQIRRGVAFRGGQFQ